MHLGFLRVFAATVFLMGFSIASHVQAAEAEAAAVVAVAKIGFYVAKLGKSSIDPGAPTRILIAAEGGTVGTLFQEAAVSQGYLIRDRFPDDQIVFIFVNENREVGQEPMLRRWGLEVVDRVSEELSLPRLMAGLLPFGAIRSIDIYAHSWKDYAVLTSQNRFTGDRSLSVLAGHFTDDAYAIFHGCNAGWELAPKAAREWRIPVAGSLVGTNFEKLHSNGNFYFNDEATKPPGPWASENALSFSYRRSCRAGGCLRMKPDNRPYDGVHGRVFSGAPFYKFFCIGLESARCLQGMTMSVLSQLDLSPLNDERSKEKYRIAVENMLCPIDRGSTLREDCRRALRAALKSGDLKYSPFAGTLAICSWSECRTPWFFEESEAFVSEYFNYLNGLKLLLQRL